MLSETQVIARIHHLLAAEQAFAGILELCLQALKTWPASEVLRQELFCLLNEHPPQSLSPPLIKALKAALRSYLPAYGFSISFAAPWLQWLLADDLPTELDTQSLLAAEKKISGETLWQQLLTRNLLQQPQFELFFTALRKDLLRRWLQRQPIPWEVVGWLAWQCWNNEYIWVMTEGEVAYLQALPVTEQGQELLLQACYAPFAELSPEAQQNLPDALQKLYHQQQRWLRASQQVSPGQGCRDMLLRDFYQQYPYPRWLELDALFIEPLAEKLTSLFPGQSLTFLRCHSPRILVAGCGSGQQVLYFRQACPQAQITAIDLSAVSLAYGQQMAEQYGLNEQILWQQADLRDWQAGPYELISCLGVLHHLPEPEQGFGALLNLLKPGGALQLSVYSQTARQPIEKLKQQFHVPQTAQSEHLKGLRQQLLESTDPLAQQICLYPDFYSLSTCQDLLFHPREHLFSLKQLQSWLQTGAAEFIGFEFWHPAYYQLYQQAFPHDHTQTLAHWALLEQRYPQLFFPMYQMWLYKT